MLVSALGVFAALFVVALAAMRLVAQLVGAAGRRKAHGPHRTIKTSEPRIPAPFTGKAYIIDGDTMVVKRTRIRLFGVDAPELSQQGGTRAKSYMINLAGGKPVRVDPVTTDCYGRIVARVWMGEVDLSDRLARDGFAVATSKWNTDYDSAELHARRNRHGLWADDPHSGITDPAAHRRWQAREDDAPGNHRPDRNVVPLRPSS